MVCVLSDAADAGSFPSLSKFPHVMVTSLLDAVKSGSHEAQLLFPRLLQIVALFPETVNDFIRAVRSSCLFIFFMFIHYSVSLFAADCCIDDCFQTPTMILFTLYVPHVYSFSSCLFITVFPHLLQIIV